MKTSRYKQWTVVAGLIGILVVQLVMMAYFGNHKNGYHMDEMLTYELANYEEAFFSRTDNFMETWVDGDFYREAMSVDGVGDLDYSIPYHNQERDVHPPLYYFLIHTMSAFFPGTVSKWIGILPNMIFCLLATALLFLVGKRILPNQGLALTVSAMWAWSIGCMSTVLFIRMYAMLTCLALAVILIHLVAWDNVQKGCIQKRTMAGLFLLTTAGILTQYYFLVLCFFLCGLFFLYLCVARRWKLLIQYTVIETAALCTSVVLFPKMLFHIFGGYRGQEAFNNMAGQGGLMESLKTVGSIISKQVMNGWLKEWVLIAVGALVVYFVCVHILHLRVDKGPKGDGLALSMDIQLDRKLKLSVSTGDLMAMWLGIVAVGYWVMISKVAPYKTDRYFLCIYPIIILCLFYLAYKTLLVCIRRPQICTWCLAVAGVVVTLASYKMQTVNYLYENYQQRYEAMQAYQGYPVIQLSINGNNQDTADVFAKEYPQQSQVFRCYKGNVAGIKQAVSTGAVEDGFLLYIQNYASMSHDQIRDLVETEVDLEQFELVTDIGCRVYFCTMEEATP